MTGETSGGVPIALDHVTKRYGTGRHEKVVATDDVSLRIASGETVALVGASGSGKSTLLHLMGAMDIPTDGSVCVADTDLGSLSGPQLAAYRRRVGFVFQRFHLLPALTVLDNVLAPLLPFRVDFDRRERAREVIDQVGLGQRENALPSRLSGGQQQRVAIARALVNRPPLILADEPTGNLDSSTGREVLDLLFDLQAATGTTIVVATHDTQVAARCDRMVRLRDGAVVEDVPLVTSEQPQQLLDQIGRLRT